MHAFRVQHVRERWREQLLSISLPAWILTPRALPAKKTEANSKRKQQHNTQCVSGLAASLLPLLLCDLARGLVYALLLCDLAQGLIYAPRSGRV